jgi:hypothetical protein
MLTRRPSPVRRRLLPLAGLCWLVCGAAALLSAGCQSDEIEARHVPKPTSTVRLLAVMLPHKERVWFFKLEGPVEKVDAHRDEFTTFCKSIRFTGKDGEPVWDLPKGWSEEEGSGLRKKNLHIGDKGENLIVTVVALPKGAGDVYSNVNRWRKQVGLNSIPPSEVDDDARPFNVEGVSGYLVDLKGPGNPLAKPAPFADMAGEKPGGGGQYELPEGWVQSPRNVEFAKATFVAGEGEKKALVTISPLKPTADRAKWLFDNVNRWRTKQANIPPLKDDDELKKITKAIAVGKDTAMYFDIFDEDSKDEKRLRIVVAIVERGDTWWFVKLFGPYPAVGQEKERFEKFLSTLNLDQVEGAKR